MLKRKVERLIREYGINEKLASLSFFNATLIPISSPSAMLSA